MERIKTRQNIMDRVTPAQEEAWNLEHEAWAASRVAKVYYMKEARNIREADRIERKRQLYEYGDAQNTLLDSINQVTKRGEQIPIFDVKELAVSGNL